MSVWPQAEEELKKLAKTPENRRCANCDAENKFGHGNICMPFKTFVCSMCKSAHQAYSHRVKSITQSNFTQAEVDSLRARMGGGNEMCRRTYLAKCPPGTKPTSNDPMEKFKQFVLDAYEHKRYYAPFAPPAASPASPSPSPVTPVSAPSPSLLPQATSFSAAFNASTPTTPVASNFPAPSAFPTDNAFSQSIANVPQRWTPASRSATTVNPLPPVRAPNADSIHIISSPLVQATQTAATPVATNFDDIFGITPTPSAATPVPASTFPTSTPEVDNFSDFQSAPAASAFPSSFLPATASATFPTTSQAAPNQNLTITSPSVAQSMQPTTTGSTPQTSGGQDLISDLLDVFCTPTPTASGSVESNTPTLGATQLPKTMMMSNGSVTQSAAAISALLPNLYNASSKGGQSGMDFGAFSSANAQPFQHVPQQFGYGTAFSTHTSAVQMPGVLQNAYNVSAPSPIPAQSNFGTIGSPNLNVMNNQNRLVADPFFNL